LPVTSLPAGRQASRLDRVDAYLARKRISIFNY